MNPTAIGKTRLEDVFKTVGLPQYTYVKPAYYGEVRADIVQPGKHLLIEGPSGVGKTCVVFRVFEDLHWSKGKDYTYLSGRDSNAETRLKQFVEEALKADSGTALPVTVVNRPGIAGGSNT